jgi:hypothetical protein
VDFERRKNKPNKGTKHLVAAVTITSRTSDPAGTLAAAGPWRDRRRVERRQPRSSHVARERRCGGDPI